MHLSGSIPIEDLDINWNDIWKRSGNNGFEPDEAIRSIFEEVCKEIIGTCRPSWCYAIYPIDGRGKGELTINGITFHTGEIISSCFAEAREAAVFTCTAGKEFEVYTQGLETEGDLVKAYFADIIGSEIAEQTNRKVREIIQKELEDTELSAGYSYCPGYCHWPLQEQQQLFALLPPSPCGISLTESCLMLPVKSVSGIIGIGKNMNRKPHGCMICNLRETCHRKP